MSFSDESSASHSRLAPSKSARSICCSTLKRCRWRACPRPSSVELLRSGESLAIWFMFKPSFGVLATGWSWLRTPILGQPGRAFPAVHFPRTAAARITAVQLFFNLPRVFDVGGGDRIGTETPVGGRRAHRSPPAASGALDFSVCFCLQALRLLP